MRELNLQEIELVFGANAVGGGCSSSSSSSSSSGSCTTSPDYSS